MCRVRLEYSSPASGEKDSSVRLKAYSLYRRRCCGALGGQVHRQHDFLVEQRRSECACCTADLWHVTAGTQRVTRPRESWCSPLFEPYLCPVLRRITCPHALASIYGLKMLT